SAGTSAALAGARRVVLLPLVVLVFGAAVCLAGDARGSSPRAGGTGSIAFAATDPLGVSAAIAGIGPAGKGRRLIGSRPPTVMGEWEASGPAWSPDGRQLAFSGDGEIWTMSADGTAPQRLTSDSDDGEPRRVRKFGRGDLQRNHRRRKTGQRPRRKSARSLERGRTTGPRKLTVATITMAAMAALGVR